MSNNNTVQQVGNKYYIINIYIYIYIYVCVCVGGCVCGVSV